MRSLSKHLSSRKNVETILGNRFLFTDNPAGGYYNRSGSASFEIIREPGREAARDDSSEMAQHTVHKNPLQSEMLIEFLSGVLLNGSTFNASL
jgi:hypothetical protein